MKRIILKTGADFKLRRGYPWVWDNEIDRVLDGFPAKDAVLELGECADVESAAPKHAPHGDYLGRAVVNPASKIRARLYSRSKEGLDTGFFKRKIREALKLREDFFEIERDSCRAVFGEADFLPGVVIDRFVGWSVNDAAHFSREEAERLAKTPPQTLYSLQLGSAAMSLRKSDIVAALSEIDPDCLIYEKSAGKEASLEGFDGFEGALKGEVGKFLIVENGLFFLLDMQSAQKTGHFLDQAQNRAALGGIAASMVKSGVSNPRVLDLFCYTGGFSLAALKNGAAVISSDASESALAALSVNAALNGLTAQCVKEDAFDYISQLAKAKVKFDIVILDPPAFAKKSSSKNEALKGYKELNLKALALLDRGGLLVTCSCSAAVNERLFTQVVESAALDARRRLQLVSRRPQSADHPVLAGYEESAYLKCLVYRVC